MMEWLTIDARLACDHGGKVGNKPSQELVRIEQRIVLVATDPEGRSISGCPSIGSVARATPQSPRTSSSTKPARRMATSPSRFRLRPA